jgi:PBP1b-binding outer membrane lipoprotein LpoB
VGLVLAGCGGKSVKRVETEKVIDISGRWNDTDSRLVSEEMIQDALNRPWLQNYRNLSGKNPVVIVGTVRNRSHEHINVQTFVKDLERALINSDMLHGTINTIVDREGGKEVKFYQVNLEFTDLETNKKAWIGEKKIKKYIKRSRFGP